METYISCVKYPNGEKYKVTVSLPNDAYGSTWFVVDDPIADKEKRTVMEGKTMPTYCLYSDEIKTEYEGKWLCCDYTFMGRYCQEIVLYLSRDSLTMIRKNQLDVVNFFDKSNGQLLHEGEYEYRYEY